LDLMPTWLLKANVDILEPFLSRLFCWSLEHGVVPLILKSAYTMLILKKSDLDLLNTKSYRPISNLSVVSKLLERLVSRQFVAYLTDKGLIPDLQSAYRANHSTETAVLKVLSDILTALDSGNLAVLMLLDL
jgi:Reverse transcriptase (RNA-dependent DNA polymerase)